MATTRSRTPPRRASGARPDHRQSDGSIGELLQHATEEAARLLEADGALVYLLDESGHLHYAHDAGIADPASRRWLQGLRLRSGEGMFGVAVAERRVIATGDYAADRSFAHASAPDEFVREVGLRSMIVAPLVAGERVFGGLGTFSARPDAFSEAQLALVRALADHAAAAMANALLIGELARSRTEAARRADVESSLRAIANRISSIQNPDEVIQRTVDEAARLLGADGARIDLIDPVINLLRWAYQSGAERPSADIWPEDPDERLDQGVSGKAVSANAVQLTGDYLTDERFAHGTTADGYIEAVGIHSVMAAPLADDAGPFGALTVYTTRRDAWGEPDAGVLEALATQAAIAIRNARLIAELDASREALGRRAEAERALREIAARITAIREPSELLQHVVEEANRLVRADGTILDLLDRRTGRLTWAYDSGIGSRFTPEQIADLWMDVGEGATGIAVAEDRVVAAGDDLISHFPPSPQSELFFSVTRFRSLIAAPITTDSGPLGALEVYSIRPYAFDDADAALIRSLADQAAIAIQNARLIEELDRSRDENARRADAERSLREIAASISAIREPDDVLQQTVNEARRLLVSDGARIDLLESGSLVWSYAAGDPKIAPSELARANAIPLGTGVAGTAVARGVPFMTGDYLPDERFIHSAQSDSFIRSRRIRSVLAVPLLGESGVLGALTVSSGEADYYAPAHAELLQALADHATIAIQNARLIEALERSREEIRHRADAEATLRRIATEITALRDPDTILQLTVDDARRLLDGKDARIDLLEGDSLVWRFTSSQFGLSASGILEETFPVTTGIAGLAVTRRRPVRTGDYAIDAAFTHTAEGDLFIRENKIHSGIAVPLIGESGPLGSITVGSDRVDAFDEADEALLQALADQATIAIQNAHLIEELQQSRIDLAQRADTERSLREMAAGIAELRDPAELLQRIVDETRRLLRSDGAHLTRLSADGLHVRPVVVAGGADEALDALLKEMEFPINGGINGLAAGQGEPTWTEDYRLDPRIPREVEDLEVADRLGLRGMAAVPLRAPEGGIIGTLAVSFRTPHGFDEDEIGLLQGMADHAAIAMTNTSLYERLRQSEERYRHLVQNSPDLVWSIDGEGHFTFLSDTCERLTGWRPEDLLGRHFGAIVHPSSREVAELDWTERMSRGSQELRGRLALLHADGHPIPAEFVAIGTLDADGRFAGANGAVRDMTDLDRLERELRASEARYRNLLQSSPDLIWAADAEGRYTFVSDSSEELLGRRPEDLIGRHFSEVIAPEFVETAARGYGQMLANPMTPLRMQFALLHADGRRIPYEVGAVGSTDETGHLLVVHGVARDVSERDRLERELRESEERYRFLLRNSPDIVFSTDADGTFLYLSETLERLTGWQPHEMIGRHFSDLVEREGRDAATSRWAAAVANPSLSQVVTLNIRHRDGSATPFEISAVGIADEAGRFAGLHGSARDVSERETLERDLRRQAAELAAGEERAHLARELHDSVTQALFSMTLLNRSVELLIDRDQAAARQRLGELRELQREALAEMRALIFELRPGNLEQDGLLHALRTHSAALQGRIGLPIVVKSEIEGRLPIEVEEVLYRIAQEALHNVVKHAAARQVRIELARDGASVVLRIVDDGKGFDPAIVPAGHLGLAGMRARAEKIGGRLDVRSRPRAGTTIDVTVPSPDAAPPAGQAVPSAK